MGDFSIFVIEGVAAIWEHGPYSEWPHLRREKFSEFGYLYMAHGRIGYPQMSGLSVGPSGLGCSQQADQEYESHALGLPDLGVEMCTITSNVYVLEESL